MKEFQSKSSEFQRTGSVHSAAFADGKRIFVVNSGSRNVSIVPADLSSLDFDTFNVDKGPTDIKVGQDSRTVYVVSELTNSIAVVDVP
jgi:DNA-binding beta-propeller fold protein YncE